MNETLNPGLKIEATPPAEEQGNLELQTGPIEQLDQLLDEMQAFRQEHGPELAQFLQQLNGKETPAQLGNALKNLPPNQVEAFKKYFAYLEEFTKRYQEAEAAQQANPN